MGIFQSPQDVFCLMNCLQNISIVIYSRSSLLKFCNFVWFDLAVDCIAIISHYGGTSKSDI